MKKGVSVWFALLGWGILVTCVSADDWYGGVEMGHFEHQFTPTYTFVEPGTKPVTYDDRANGLNASLIGGYRCLPVYRVSLALQARATFYDNDWELNINNADEVSHLKYDQPYSYLVSFVPGVFLTDDVVVYADLGIGQGYITEKKESLNSSSYDFAEWVTGYSIGGGVSWEMTRQVSLFAVYRYTWYENFNYNSYLPDGRHWETITEDKVTTSSANVGIAVHF